MAYQNILLDRRGNGIALVTMNQPERRNPLSVGMQKDLLAVVEEIRQDDTLRVMLITGSGPVFCAGADLSYMCGRSSLELREYLSCFPG